VARTRTRLTLLARHPLPRVGIGNTAPLKELGTIGRLKPFTELTTSSSSYKPMLYSPVAAAFFVPHGSI